MSLNLDLPARAQENYQIFSIMIVVDPSIATLTGA